MKGVAIVLLAVIGAGCASSAEPMTDAATEAPQAPAVSDERPPEELRITGRILRPLQATVATQTTYLNDGEKVFEVPTEVKALRFTLAWTPTSPASNAIELDLGYDGGYIGRATGASPLVIELAEDNVTSGEIHILLRSQGAVGGMIAQEFAWEAVISQAAEP